MFARRHAISTNFRLLLIGLTSLTAGSGCAWMQSLAQLRDGMGRSLADRAMEARARGDEEEAVALLERAVSRDPEQVDLHRDLAELYHEQSRGEDELRHLIRVAELESDCPHSWANLGRVLADQGYEDRARRATDEALLRDPAHTKALLVRAQLLEERGRAVEALGVYHRVLEADPSDVEARLAVARMHLRLGHAERAAPVLRSLCECPLAEDHEKAEAWWSLGIAYGRIGRWTDAVRALDAGTAHRDSADDWYRRAFARRAAGDVGGAREALEEVRDRQPDHEAGRRLAIALASLDQSVVPVNARTNVPVPSGW